MKREIGVIDSGLGGISVLSNLKEHYPNYHYVFVGDQKHAPYGDRSKSELIELGRNLLTYFKKRNIKEVVIACNTLCSNAMEELKTLFPDMKLHGIIEVTCEQLDKEHKKVCVMATNATIHSHAYKKVLEKDFEVSEVACPKLVPCIEQGKSDEEIHNALNEYLEKHYDVDALILGCTHYPLISNLIKQHVPNAKIYDSNDAIMKALELNYENKNAELEIYTTKDAKQMQHQILAILNKDYEVKHLDLTV